MYVVSFIDDGKLVQVSTPSATIAATLAGYLPTCRVFKNNKLVQDMHTEACIAELRSRYKQLDPWYRQHVRQMMRTHTMTEAQAAMAH